MAETKWNVEFYTDARNQSPVREHIKSLQARDRVKVTHVLKLLEEFGTQLRSPHAEFVEDGIWELRASRNRLFYFLHVDQTFIILHGYFKKTPKAPRKEINTAKRRRDDYLRRWHDAT